MWFLGLGAWGVLQATGHLSRLVNNPDLVGAPTRHHLGSCDGRVDGYPLQAGQSHSRPAAWGLLRSPPAMPRAAARMAAAITQKGSSARRPPAKTTMRIFMDMNLPEFFQQFTEAHLRGEGWIPDSIDVVMRRGRTRYDHSGHRAAIASRRICRNSTCLSWPA